MSEKENGELVGSRRALAIAVASAFVGGAGGPMLLLQFGDDSYLRPDPFTGAQGAAMERRITSLEDHIVRHPDIVNKYDRRITTLEVHYANIIANQNKIIERLDRRTEK